MRTEEDGRGRTKNREGGVPTRRRCPEWEPFLLEHLHQSANAPIPGTAAAQGHLPPGFSGCGLISIWRQTISRLTEGRNLGMSAEQAMTALGVSESERGILSKRI